jgi:hypothetical protein
MLTRRMQSSVQQQDAVAPALLVLWQSRCCSPCSPVGMLVLLEQRTEVFDMQQQAGGRLAAQ